MLTSCKPELVEYNSNYTKAQTIFLLSELLVKRDGPFLYLVTIIQITPQVIYRQPVVFAGPVESNHRQKYCPRSILQVRRDSDAE